MYISKAFNVSDKQILANFIRENSFGILFLQTEQGPFASHLPFLLQEEGEHNYLIGHMAKANPQWQDSNGKEVLVVFPGPHAYISPTWYGEPNTVPTWNYTTVHVYGKMRLVEGGEELRSIIADSLDFYEAEMPSRWQADFNDTFIKQLMKAIVGFKIEIGRVEGKWKLGQNQTIARQQRVIAALRQMEQDNSQAIADLMEANVAKVLGE